MAAPKEGSHEVETDHAWCGTGDRRGRSGGSEEMRMDPEAIQRWGDANRAYLALENEVAALTRRLATS